MSVGKAVFIFILSAYVAGVAYFVLWAVSRG